MILRGKFVELMYRFVSVNVVGLCRLFSITVTFLSLSTGVFRPFLRKVICRA